MCGSWDRSLIKIRSIGTIRSFGDKFSLGFVALRLSQHIWVETFRLQWKWKFCFRIYPCLMIAEAKNKNDPDKGACKGQQKEKFKCERDDDQKERWD